VELFNLDIVITHRFIPRSNHNLPSRALTNNKQLTLLEMHNTGMRVWCSLPKGARDYSIATSAIGVHFLSTIQQVKRWGSCSKVVYIFCHESTLLSGSRQAWGSGALWRLVVTQAIFSMNCRKVIDDSPNLGQRSQTKKFPAYQQGPLHTTQSGEDSVAPQSGSCLAGESPV